jgi:hypothetical protein
MVSPSEFEEALKDWLGGRFLRHSTWPNRTTSGGWSPRGIMHHWTAMSGLSVSAVQQNSVLVYGHSTLAGPLCHLGIHRAGQVTAVGWGNCNHAGKGDQRVYRAIESGTYNGSFRGTVEDLDGNPLFWGLEYHYHPDDGTMPDEQVESGILAAAAICEAEGWSPNGGAGSNLDHYEWTDRKVDRKKDGLSARTRDGVRRALTNGPQGEDMTPAESKMLADIHGRLFGVTHQRWVDRSVTPPVPARLLDTLDGAYLVKTISANTLDPEKLAELIVQKIGGDGNIDVETVKRGVREVFAEFGEGPTG